MLDTHVLIWSFQNDDRLGPQARAVIADAVREGGVMVPAFCAWEIAHLDRSGTVPFAGGAIRWMRDVLAVPGFQLAPLTPEIAIDSVAMEWEHKDPADRLIAATARALDCPLVTADRKILGYAATGHVRAIDARL